MAEPHSFDFSEPSGGHVPVLDRGHLHRQLRVPQLFAIGYGDVGSSIYYALGVTTLYALGAAPLALLLAGAVFVCTVLTYAELSAAMPEAGGSCSFARHAFNDLVSFIAGWALLLDYIVTIAISAYTVGPYLGYFFPILKSVVGNIPFTLGIIAVLLGINLIGIKESTRISLLLCIFATATQLSVILIGLVTVLNLPYLVQHLQIGVIGVDWSPTWPQFFKGVGMAMVAYIGIESIAQLAGETSHPDRNLPKAMLLVMGALLILYFGIAAVALSAMHPLELTSNYLQDPLAGVVAHLPIGGKLLQPWIAILGAAILFVAANAGLIGASRLTFAMGDYFQLPRFFYRLHPRFKTPYISLITFAVIAGLIVFIAKELTFIAELYNFGAMLAFALAHLALIGSRIRQPDLKRPFKAPLNFQIGKAILPLTAVIGLLGTAAVWVDVILTKPAGRNLGFAWLALGVVSYLVYRRQQRLPATSRLDIEKLTIPEFHPVKIKKILVPTRGGAQTEVVQFAVHLAKAYGGDVTALYVIEIAATLPLDTFFPEKLIEGDKALERAQAIGREYGVPLETQILQSRSAGETIIETAKEGKFDLIVLGASKKGSPTTMGSTVDYVLKHAPCRVWICV